ncbi:hypothetical protein K435DRAFT_871780 [Dendrothele bispora CBS 962.96]|uniref:Uncharacterized protein n=1 Tax=Dendrothele bispora (strain CBS 962.96) TaxID=1314807 RepID=A0A4S8L4K0_DENBC|nr:hypothetical protein K435DRAFT_871780 [Dendrothele bispora CBS 962.96]
MPAPPIPMAEVRTTRLRFRRFFLVSGVTSTAAATSIRNISGLRIRVATLSSVPVLPVAAAVSVSVVSAPASMPASLAATFETTPTFTPTHAKTDAYRLLRRVQRLPTPSAVREAFPSTILSRTFLLRAFPLRQPEVRTLGPQPTETIPLTCLPPHIGIGKRVAMPSNLASGTASCRTLILQHLPWSPSKRVRFSSPVPADAGVESSGNSAAIPAPAEVAAPRLVIRIPARPRPVPATVSGQPEASTSTAGSSASAIQAPTPVRRSMATLGPPSSEAGPSSAAAAPPRATTTTGLTRAEAIASISTIEPGNCRPGRTLVPLIVEDLRETDVQFDFDAPGLEMLTPSPPTYVPGSRQPTSADIIRADQMSLDPRAFLQQWVRDHRHDADQTVVGRVDEYLRSFERFDIRNFSRALGDFLEDRDIDDPELDLQYPSTTEPAVPTLDATVETIMRGPASPVTESEASAGRDDSPMSIDEFPVRMSIDNSIFAEESEEDGPEPEGKVAQQSSIDVPAPADPVPESTDLEVEIPPVDSEVPAEQADSPLPGPSAAPNVSQDDEIVDESGYDWGNLSRYQPDYLSSSELFIVSTSR